MAVPERITENLPALASLAAAGVWIVLATRNPDLTYHFAPAIAAAAWPWLARGGPKVLPVAGGIAIALAATALLMASDSLQGPTLWGSDGALGESMASALIGGAVGILVQGRREVVSAPV